MIKQLMSAAYRYIIKKKYNLTPETWMEIFESQGRRCRICKCTEPRGGRWSVDHDHWLGGVRGILCVHCNAMLGLAKDNQDILAEAQWYLECQRIAF